MKIYKCQFCGHKIIVNNYTRKKGVNARKQMGEHIDKMHKDLIPPDMDGYRWFYYQLTKQDHGSCVICKHETDFNRSTMKYCRFCNNPQCKQKYKEERDQRMIAKYGKIYLLDDPEQQKKMLQGRKISGTYLWSDNKTKIGYVGSYEKDFLRHLDEDLKFPIADLMMPSPHTYTYEYKGTKHFYIPDAFIVSKNLEIEIKDDGSAKNINPESREKDIIKDDLMKSCSNLFNYIKIINKNYKEFDEFLSKEE